MGMDVIVGFLAGWAVHTAHRVGQRVSGHTDQALEALVDRVWAILAAKLGANSWLNRLRTEAAQTGTVSPEVRGQTQRVLQSAADQDPRFAHDLLIAVQAAINHTVPQPPAHNTGNYIGSIVAGGRVSIRQKIVTLARRRPLPFAATILVLVGLLAWGSYGIVASFSDSNGSQSVRQVVGTGDYTVGKDMTPGIYTSPRWTPDPGSYQGGGRGCYYAKYKDDSFAFGSLINNWVSEEPMEFTATEGEFIRIKGCTFTRQN